MNGVNDIVLIDANPFTREALRAVLDSVDGISFDVIENCDDAALNEINRLSPRVVILNLYPAVQGVLEFAGQLTQRLQEMTLVVTAAKMDPDLIRQVMRQGAREFLPQPFQPEEIRSALTSILAIQKPNGKQEERKAQVITLFGAKGGVGATTLTTNLAVMLAREAQEEVLVLDLNLQFGNDALFLNLKSRYSIHDVLSNLAELDLELFKRTLPRHATGVTLLPNPLHIEEAEGISGAQISRIVQMLRPHFDWILIDSHPYFNEVSIQALDDAERILLVSALDLPTIFNTKRCLELFQKMGYAREKALLVLNRYQHYDGADPVEMENLLEYPVFARIPNHEFSSAIACVNQGVPVTLKQPAAKMSQAIVELMNKLNSRMNGKGSALPAKNGLFARWKK
jgi:pilus assembly protein CpaE